MIDQCSAWRGADGACRRKARVVLNDRPFCHRCAESRARSELLRLAPGLLDAVLYLVRQEIEGKP